MTHTTIDSTRLGSSMVEILARLSYGPIRQREMVTTLMTVSGHPSQGAVYASIERCVSAGLAERAGGHYSPDLRLTEQGARVVGTTAFTAARRSL
jgi:hypothetical protein